VTVLTTDHTQITDAMLFGVGGALLLSIEHAVCWDDAAIADGQAPDNPLYLSREAAYRVGVATILGMAGLWALRHPRASTLSGFFATVTIAVLSGGTIEALYWCRRRFRDYMHRASAGGAVRGFVNGIRHGTPDHRRAGG